MQFLNCLSIILHLIHFLTLCRPIISSGNVLLVQFVSDLSVTSDGFLAQYTSVPKGSPITPVDSGYGTRSTPQRPPVAAPATPKRPVIVQPTLAPPPAPTRRPRPVKPTRGRGQDSSGQDRRVPVTRPNGKRPGELSYLHVCVSMKSV